MSEKVGIRKEVERKFRLFLMANELRQTPERFAILDAIYSIQKIPRFFIYAVSYNTTSRSG